MSKRNFTARSDEVEFVFTAFIHAAQFFISRNRRAAGGAARRRKPPR